MAWLEEIHLEDPAVLGSVKEWWSLVILHNEARKKIKASIIRLVTFELLEPVECACFQ